MPHVWSHLIFGGEAMKAAGREEAIGNDFLRRVFNLGCQGPDILFYHRFWLGPLAGVLPSLAGDIHRFRCGDFLLAMIDMAAGRPSDDPIIVYAAGFLTHHVLDRNMHPFVFYRSGFRKWNHQRLEVALDALVVRRKLGLEAWKTPLAGQIDVGGRLPEGVAKMWDHLARRHNPERTAGLSPEVWHEAYRDMKRALRLFHDPWGVKRALTLGRTAPMTFRRRYPPLDYANEAHAVWRHPAVPEETHAESWWDLWDAALEDARSVLEKAFSYLESGGDVSARAALAGAIGDVGYDTGKPCGGGYVIRYAEPIL
ncbi:MAG: hypothetical protein BLM47_05555 [Candidatus Reconcilbacillus cellulovorans]|uniref:Phospholipase C/D domain-containing protein n=1 Tax=Candidatus Reconcilbacillus cellulovorans TaxID=1906605 RepID=A0A2A6E225_9BACL|nr:MAG: hypothetical protein BLM47_05555 [Candidatus Reconcilbacillus cellulovorans]